MYPSGLFATDDAGRSWRPLPGGDRSGWLAGQLLNLRSGALAGHNGSLGVVERGEINAAPADELELRSYAQMRLVPPANGWLVGEGGLVRITRDRGRTWEAPPGELPKSARHFDFTALAARGTNAGSPAPGHSRVPLCRWRPYLERFPHRLDRAVAGNCLRRRPTWLGRRRTGHDPGHPRRRENLAAPTGRRHARGLAGSLLDPEDVPLELIARMAGNEAT